MFSLIITIISIALVVALVAATMYYGGSALNKGTETADAAGLVSGAQQIVAAVTLHQSLEGSVPANVAALVTAKYLSSVPATVAGTTWTMTNVDTDGNVATLERQVTTAGPKAQFSDAVCDRLTADGGTLYSCTKGATADDPNTFTFNY